MSAATAADLAAALDKARAAHERFPEDRARELVFHAARADWLDAQLRLSEAAAAAAKAEASGERAARRRLERGFRARIDAVIAKHAPSRRRRAKGEGAAPLFDGVLA